MTLGLLPCDRTSVVPAHGALRLKLPASDLSDDDYRRAIGVTLEFAIGGGAQASVVVK